MKKALGSVSMIGANGTWVAFAQDGSYIEIERNKDRLWLREDTGEKCSTCSLPHPDRGLIRALSGKVRRAGRSSNACKSGEKLEG